MKSRIFILLAAALLVNNLNLHGQMKVDSKSISRVVRIANLFDCYGVIFDSSYKVPIIIRDIAGRFTPSETDITIGEKIFVEQYNISNEQNESIKGTPIINDVKKTISEVQ
jgi:hypothetical protein